MEHRFKTSGGVTIQFTQEELIYEGAVQPLIDRLDSHLGAVFSSGYEYPGRYTCWDIGFCDPPLSIVCRQANMLIRALNARGLILLHMIAPLIHDLNCIQVISDTQDCLEFEVLRSNEAFSEEERSLQPSIFSVLRQILAFFKADADPYLGLYGAFGYDMIFQFEDLKKHKERDAMQRDMVLYLPDEIIVVNHPKQQAFIRRYDFEYENKTTKDLPREGKELVYQADHKPETKGDHLEGEYVETVKLAKERFSSGDLFEVVPSQSFYTHFKEKPSDLFRRMCRVNPSPYGFLINLGNHEYLVGASPEMYVRVQGKRVETCPISGTIRRGRDAIEDAKNIQTLLSSEKEKSELTMCTDVDRNDKSRICEAGSVEVIGRRQIEMYSRVIHTVDHVEGFLREGYDAIDAFLTHLWVVTVTGAPKIWAMDFIETHEKTPRKWYGGAVGWLGFDGNMNTGLVLRTVHILQGIAEIRAGATLLYDSDPELEEQETRLKASAFLALLERSETRVEPQKALKSSGRGMRILLIDHQDSFVHTLGNYLRQTGATVETLRFDRAAPAIQKGGFDLVVLSPGPGRPSDFNLHQTIDLVLSKNISLFGVCLGLQGIVEYFGGELKVLDYPMHGKPSIIQVKQALPLFKGLGDSFTAGRYHSLYAEFDTLPDELKINAITEDNIIMGVSHQSLPIHAVQFHPETILSLQNQAGIKIINNLINMVHAHAR